MLLTTKYIRKPLYVDAVRVTSKNFEEVAEWCDGEINDSDANENLHFIFVRVTNPLNVRQSQARIGDWILYTERGYKVYTPKAFDKSFDPVEAEEQMELKEEDPAEVVAPG